MHVPAKLVRKQGFVTDRGSGRRAAAWFRSVKMYAARETIGDRGAGRSRGLYPAQPAETVQCSDWRPRLSRRCGGMLPFVFESFSFEPRGFESEHPHLHEVEARP
jgi:hypothetical protein